MLLRHVVDNELDDADILQVRSCTLLDKLNDPYQLEQMLVKYVQSGIEAIGAATWHLHFTHDKGNVLGQQLEPACFITDQDVAVISCPKAVSI